VKTLKDAAFLAQGHYIQVCMSLGDVMYRVQQESPGMRCTLGQGAISRHWDFLDI
jgi:hypothetical protein